MQEFAVEKPYKYTDYSEYNIFPVNIGGYLFILKAQYLYGCNFPYALGYIYICQIKNLLASVEYNTTVPVCNLRCRFG